jgi:hypothetical protein
MGIFNKNGLTYTGAGVLIVENYYTKKNTTVPCVLFVRIKSSGLYMDFGGSYETTHGTISNTAHSELREESRNLFNIDPKHMKTCVDIPTRNGTYYRSYLIKVDGICRKYFNFNRKLIDMRHTKGQKVPRSWRETDKIAHVPISSIDFNKLGDRGIVVVKDIDGKAITLHRRLNRVLYHAEALIFSLLKTRSIAERKDIKIHTSNSWTNGTYSYMV